MALEVTYPKNLDNLPQEQQDFVTQFRGLPFLMMQIGVGSWGEVSAWRVPKSFVTASVLERMQVVAYTLNYRLPTFVTVEWLESINDIDANISFVTTRQFNGNIVRIVKRNAVRAHEEE